MSEPLKPCPFCGSEPYECRHLTYSNYGVTCRCGASGPTKNAGYRPLRDAEIRAHNEAVEAWNTRAALAAGEAKPEHDPARAVQVWDETLTTPQDKARFLARYFRQFERSGHAIDGQPLHLFTADVLDALAAGEARPTIADMPVVIDPNMRPGEIKVVAGEARPEPMAHEFRHRPTGKRRVVFSDDPQPAVTSEWTYERPLYTAPPQPAEPSDLLALVRECIADLDEPHDGGHPDHDHAVPGRWDEDGAECAECERWRKMRAALVAPLSVGSGGSGS